MVGRAVETCWWCGREATLLCDHVIGMERRKSDNTLIVDQGYTCDAELCAAHAKKGGNICGSKAVTDTIDVCPEHAALGLGGDLRSLPSSKEDADRVRRGIRAKALRSRMRLAEGEDDDDG